MKRAKEPYEEQKSPTNDKRVRQLEVRTLLTLHTLLTFHTLLTLQLEVRTQANHGDEHLPSSHTCFNALDIPR